MSSFKDLRIVDNFYQTSAFFPMPTVLVSTLAEDGSTSLGAYSLIQPYYIAGKDYYAMLLCCRNSSNTAQHILRNKKCALNFIPDNRKYFKEAVRLGFPGDTPGKCRPLRKSGRACTCTSQQGSILLGLFHLRRKAHGNKFAHDRRQTGRCGIFPHGGCSPGIFRRRAYPTSLRGARSGYEGFQIYPGAGAWKILWR